MIKWLPFILAAAVGMAQSAPAQEPVRKENIRSESKVEKKAEQEVKAVIDSMLTLSEKAEYTTLLLRYVYPPELERILSDGMTVEALAERFREEKAEKLQSALKAIRKQKPSWNSDYTRATFEQEGKDVVFTRYNNQWYLRN